MVRVFGRLLPGTPRDAAERELDGISERFYNDLTASLTGQGPSARGPAPGALTQPANASPPAGGRAPIPNPRPAAIPASSGGGVSSPRAIAAPQSNASRPGPGGPGFRLPFADAKVQLVPLQEQLARQSRTTLWLLLGAVAFVLLIACANIANLQLARAAGRKRDAAIRAALGASPVRLALELLAENLLLATAGGLLGVLLAWWGTQALQAWLSDFLPRINPVGVNAPVLGFGVLLAGAAGLGFGLAPALHGSRVDLLETLKEGGHQSSPAGHRWRQALVSLEIALALVLAVNTGLLVKSIYRLYSTDLGYRTSDVLTANLSLPRRYGTPAQQRDFSARWLAALQALPGVKQAALTDFPPLSPYNTVVIASGQGPQANASSSAPPPTMSVASATSDYFRATGIALRRGRFFGEQDGADAAAVALVNEEFVRQFYPGGLTLGAPVNQPVAGGHGDGAPSTAAIIGVVADTRPRGFESSALPLAYFPLVQQPRARLSAVLQFEGDSASLARAVTVATHRIDPDVALDNPQTLEQQIARQTAPRRVTLMLTSAFAGVAITLAALGIFGVMSFTVTQRTREIGLRMALGADGPAIMRWMLRYGGVAIGGGLLAGAALAAGSSQLLKTVLTGVTAFDPAMLAAGVLVLALIGLAACLLPAYRATRINPVEALRNE
jgi:predicted permease